MCQLCNLVNLANRRRLDASPPRSLSTWGTLSAIETAGSPQVSLPGQQHNTQGVHQP